MAISQAGRIAAAGLVVAALDFLYHRALGSDPSCCHGPGTGADDCDWPAGEAAYEGGTGTAVLGVLLHVRGAFSWTVVFLLMSRRIPAISRFISTTRGRITAGLPWGRVIWLVMDLVVLPLSRARPTPVSSPHFYINLMQHAVMIGLPMVLILDPPANDHQRRHR